MPTGFRVNAPPYDFRARIQNGGSGGDFAGLVDITYRAREEITWGLPFLSTVTGISVLVETTDSLNPLLDDWSVVITPPAAWGLPHTETASGVTFKHAVVLIEGYTLTVDQDTCEAVFHAESLKLYLVEDLNDFGTWDLVYELGAYTTDPFTYDARFNDVFVAPAFVAPTLADGSPPDCAFGGIDFEDEFDREGVAIASGGYQNKIGGTWRSDAIFIDNDLAPGCGCEDCFEPLFNIGYLDSWDVTVEERIRNAQWMTDFESFECPCPDGFAIQGRYWKHLLITREYAEVNVFSRSAGIQPIEKQTACDCTTQVDGVETGSDSDSFDDTNTEAYTECRFHKESARTLGERKCIYNIDVTDCLGTGGLGGGEPGVCDETETRFCDYSGSADVLHPEAPPCNFSDRCPSYDVSFSGRHFVGFVRNGTFWTGRNDNAESMDWDFVDSGIDADCVCLRCDRQVKDSPLFAWIEDGGSITRYRSDDEGNTWGMSSPWFDGVSPAAIIARHGMQYGYAILDVGGGAFDVHGEIRDRADNVLVSEFTAYSGVDNAGLAVDEFVAAGGKHQLRLWAIIGGTMTALLSDDGETFA